MLCIIDKKEYIPNKMSGYFHGSHYKREICVYVVMLCILIPIIIGSIVGLALSAHTYNAFNSTMVFTDCNVTSCLTYEGVCGSTACFIRTWYFVLDLDDVVYNKTYTETSHYDMGGCPPENDTIACYYDWTNVNNTLTLKKPYDNTIEDSKALIIVTSIGIFLNVPLSLLLVWYIITSYRNYRIAKAGYNQQCNAR